MYFNTQESPSIWTQASVHVMSQNLKYNEQNQQI